MNEFIEYMLSEQSFLDTANAIHEKEEDDDAIWRERYRSGNRWNYYYNKEHYTDWKEGHRECGCYLYCDGQHEVKRDRAWRRRQRKKKIASRSKVIENWGNRPSSQMLAWIEDSMQNRSFNFKLDDYPRIKDIQNVRKSMGMTKKQFSQSLSAISENVRKENFQRNLERYQKGEIKIMNYQRVWFEETYQRLAVDDNGNYFYKPYVYKRSEVIGTEEKDATKILKRLKKMSRDYGVSQWFLRHARGVVTGRLADHQYRMGTGWKHECMEWKQKLLWDVLRKEIEEEVLHFFLDQYGLLEEEEDAWADYWEDYQRQQDEYYGYDDYDYDYYDYGLEIFDRIKMAAMGRNSSVRISDEDRINFNCWMNSSECIAKVESELKSLGYEVSTLSDHGDLYLTIKWD